jgi:hypothetical protein
MFFLSGAIQRVFTLKSFIIMSDISNKCSQKEWQKYSHIKIYVASDFI